MITAEEEKRNLEDLATDFRRRFLMHIAPSAGHVIFVTGENGEWHSTFWTNRAAEGMPTPAPFGALAVKCGGGELLEGDGKGIWRKWKHPSAPISDEATRDMCEREKVPAAPPEKISVVVNESARTRTFEVEISDNLKVCVTVEMWEDMALPSPLERPNWERVQVKDLHVIAASAALLHARELAHFELD